MYLCIYVLINLTLSVLNILAISGTSGSSGFGSHRREQMDNNTGIKNDNSIIFYVIHYDIILKPQKLS